MEIRVGTSGYAYKEWRGSFYPEKLKPAQMLGYYAERFSAVEINNTFYKLPERQTLERWGEQVPAGFVFVLKASQRITHRQRLAPESKPTLDYLLDTAAALGDRLGPILFRPRPSSRRTLRGCAPSWTCCRATGVSPSSSATRAGGATRPTRRCARATPRSCAPTPKSRAPLARRSSRPPTGATCVCAAPATMKQRSRRGPRGSARSPGSRPSCSSSTKKASRSAGPRSSASSGRGLARMARAPEDRSNPPGRGCVSSKQRSSGG